MVAQTLIMALRGIISNYKASLSYTMSSRPTWATVSRPLSQKERKRNQMAQGRQQSIQAASSMAGSGCEPCQLVSNPDLRLSCHSFCQRQRVL